MKMNPTCNWKTVLFLSAGASILSRLTAKIKQLITSSKSVTVNEVLLYGAGEENKKKQLGLNNLYCIYYVLVHASRTIDVCMPSLDSATITKCLMNVRQKNKTKVRIIVHRKPDSSLSQLLDCGIKVKVIREAEIQLEHEFMVIDAQSDCGEALVIIGSLDYEAKRVNCNSDSTLLTSENAIVSTLNREFNRIWNSTAAQIYQNA